MSIIPEEIVILSVEDARIELATIQAGLNEYYTGKRRTKLTVGSNTFNRVYMFSDSAQLFDFMVKRADILKRYIAEQTISTTAIPTFRRNTNIPMIFKRNS